MRQGALIGDRDALENDGKALKGDAEELNLMAVIGDGICLSSSKLLLYVTFRHWRSFK